MRWACKILGAIKCGDRHESLPKPAVIVVWILLGLAVLLLLWGVFSYNRFVSQRNLIKDAWSNIATELQRRYDLIPNLVETVKGYAAHEQGTFEAVTRRGP